MIIGLALFAIGILVTVYYALALFYHWLTYRKIFPVVSVMLPIYIIGSVFFLYTSLMALRALI